LESATFCGHIIEFDHSESIGNKDLLGVIVYSPLTLKFDAFKETSFNQIAETRRVNSNVNLFKTADDNNLLFIANGDGSLNIARFDKDGCSRGRITNALSLEQDKQHNDDHVNFKIVQFGSNYLCYATFLSATFKTFITGNLIENDGQSFTNMLFTLSSSLYYLKHRFECQLSFSHMAANKTYALCIDSNFNFYLYNSDLEVVRNKPLDKLKENLSRDVIGVEMSDRNMFFLCGGNKLKIFDIRSLILVHEVETSSASQIKLASLDYVYLFDKSERTVCVYTQSADFIELDEIDLPPTIANLNMACDKTKFITFYDSSRMMSSLICD
jgi:hypothetical protein